MQVPLTMSCASDLTLPLFRLGFAIRESSTKSTSNSPTIISPSTSTSPTASSSLISPRPSAPVLPLSDFSTRVQSFLEGCRCSCFDGYELGPGAVTWVYEKARVEVELFREGLGTGLGAEVWLLGRLWLAGGDLFQGVGPGGGDSGSDPLSHASSSPQSLKE